MEPMLESVGGLGSGFLAVALDFGDQVLRFSRQDSEALKDTWMISSRGGRWRAKRTF